MLVIMNGYNQTRGSNAFLMVFSCAGMAAALMYAGAGVLAVLLAGEEVGGGPMRARL